MARFALTTARYPCPPQQLVEAWFFGPAGNADKELCKAEESCKARLYGPGQKAQRSLSFCMQHDALANHGVSTQELRLSWEQGCEMSPENQGMTCGLITCVKMPLCFNSLFSETVLSCVQCRPLNGDGDFEESLAELWSLCRK